MSRGHINLVPFLQVFKVANRTNSGVITRNAFQKLGDAIMMTTAEIIPTKKTVKFLLVEFANPTNMHAALELSAFPNLMNAMAS